MIHFVRHARAGERDGYEGDDRLRPLDRKGARQAERITELLRKRPLKRVISSPYVRCTQTVEPLAKALKLHVEESDDLAEGSPLEDTLELLRVVAGAEVVLCSHGDVIGDLVAHLVSERLVRFEDARFDKGSIWQLEMSRGRIASARYVKP